MHENDEETESNNIVSYILGFVIFICLGFFVYFYLSYEFFTKEEFKNNYTKNHEITFEHLPYYIQSLYILEEDSSTKINKIKTSNILNSEKEIIKLKDEIKLIEKQYRKEKSLLNQKIYIFENKIDKLNEKIKSKNHIITKLNSNLLENKNTILILNKNLKEVKKQKDTIHTKEVVKLVNNNRKSIISKNYKTLMCTDMPLHDAVISQKCKTRINIFALNNKNALYFEVMGFLGKNEYLHNNKLKVLLSKKRVSLAMDTLNKALKNEQKVSPVNYEITSTYTQKGVIIRAYY